MIFRKPDAFIIKHIKIIHVIILLGIGYLLYKTNDITNVYSEVEKSKSIIGTNYSTQIYNTIMYIVLLFCLAMVLMIIIILIKRKKRFVFYLATAILLAFSFVFYILSYSNISTMQKNNVSAPTYLAYSDISRILFYAQSGFVIVWLFKTSRFDIKTFSFGKASYDLDLTDADSEEIEFSLEIDGNELKTKRRRRIRNLKYFYLENRWKINLAIILIVAIIGISINAYIKSNKPIYYGLNSELRTRDYNIVVTDAYFSYLDYSGKKIEEKGEFIILKFKIKKNFEQEYSFDDSYLSVIINDKAYYANSKYFEYFTDLGEAYKDQKLSQEYQDYYLVYQIPYEFSNKEIYIKVSNRFDYKTNRYSYYEIKTNYEYLDKTEKVKEFRLNDEMNIEAYGVKAKVVINDFDIKDKFKVNFNAVVNEKNYNLIEYITPTAEDNEDKAIMRLSYEETNSESNKTNFATILLKYAIIEYKIDNNEKEGYFYSFISPKLSKEPNVYYIQVSKDILNGNNRAIKIKVRDQIFKYSLD